jgi:hypothetical protein
VKTLCLVVLLAAVPAFADIVPDEVGACQGKKTGAACTTPEGEAGTCVNITVSRPDYSGGVPPTYKPVQMLGCVATAKGTARSMLPWVGTGLAFLAMLMAMLLKGRRPALA